MKNQNCRIGAVTPITQGSHAISILEYQYHLFVEKAKSSLDSRLVDFFEAKAKSVKKILDELS